MVGPSPGLSPLIVNLYERANFVGGLANASGAPMGRDAVTLPGIE